MSKCSKSCNPNANFERLKEIDALFSIVMGIANLEITHMNAPNSLGDVFQKAKSRLLYLIPGEGPVVVGTRGAPEVKEGDPIIRRARTLPASAWRTVKAGDGLSRDIDVAVVGDFRVFRVASEKLKEAGYTFTSLNDPNFLAAPRQLIAALQAREAELGKKVLKKKATPGGTLKAKVKTVSSVETVKSKSKSKAKKKGKA
jgi:hypothetical protein